jgi:hypothetical protein
LQSVATDGTLKVKDGEDVIMALRGKFITGIAVLAAAWLASGPAMASNFFGQVPVGYSESVFQIGGGASSLAININALGSRDPGTCASCNSIYTDNFTVKLFDQAGTLLESMNAINYLYFSMYGNSHGIGAGPVGFAVPSGATTLEIVSRLSIAGLLGSDGHPLSFGNLTISTDGSIAAATPIPATLPLLATGLVALGLLGWQRQRKANAGLGRVADGQKKQEAALAGS